MTPGPGQASAVPGERAAELLVDAFGRVHELVQATVSGLAVDQLAWRPGPRANSIAWLIWHLSRVEDDHLAGISGGEAGGEQVWLAQGWCERFALPFAPADIGYGQTSEQVAMVRADATLLTGYYDAVHARTLDIVRALTEADYDRIVDRRWAPPVTAAVRLVSVVNDVTQHVGQAAYVRGLLRP